MKKVITLLALTTMGVASAQASGNVTLQLSGNTATNTSARVYSPSLSVNGQYLVTAGNTPVTLSGKLGLRAVHISGRHSVNYNVYGGAQVSTVYEGATFYAGVQREFVQNTPTTYRIGIVLGTPVNFYGDR